MPTAIIRNPILTVRPRVDDLILRTQRHDPIHHIPRAVDAIFRNDVGRQARDMRGGHTRTTQHRGIGVRRAPDPGALDAHPGGENVDVAPKVGEARAVVVAVRCADRDGAGLGGRRVSRRIDASVPRRDDSHHALAHRACDGGIQSRGVPRA